MTNEQIVALYEDNDLTIPQIAEQLEIGELAIKTALAQGSSIYRNNAKNGFEDIITDDEFDQLKHAAFKLAFNAENESVRAAMTKFLFEQRMVDKRGLRDVPQVNVLLLQQILSGARNKIEKSLEIVNA